MPALHLKWHCLLLEGQEKESRFWRETDVGVSPSSATSYVILTKSPLSSPFQWSCKHDLAELRQGLDGLWIKDPARRNLAVRLVTWVFITYLAGFPKAMLSSC